MTAQEIPFCPDAFTFLTHAHTRFHACCPSWMHESRFIYDMPDDLWEVWNHQKMIEWRQALLEGDYRYCQHCPNRFRQRDRTAPLADEKAVMDRPPITYGLGDNITCNLSCPSCRNHVAIEKSRHPYTPWKVMESFPTLQTMALSLAGDPFANPEFRRFLQEPGPPDIILWTNGILLPKYWSSIRKRVTVLVMSVDGCTSETYEHLRRGASWAQVLYSLDFIKHLMEANTFVMWQINVVVQQANFKELADLVDLAIYYGVTKIQFAPIAPWPHMSMEQWRDCNVLDPTHPQHHECLAALQDPRMSLSIVDSGLLSDEIMKLYGTLTPLSDLLKMKR